MLNKLFEIVGWLKWPFALSMLGYLVWRNQEGFLELATGDKNWGYLLAGLVLCGVCAGLTFVRWYLLVWAQEFDFTLKDAFRLGGLGMLCNYGGPGIVGGDLIKAAIVARNQQSRRAVAAATVVLDRLLGLLALFMVGALATLFIDLDATQVARATQSEGEGWLSQVPMLTVVSSGLWLGSLGGLLGLCLLLYPGTTRWPIFRKLVSFKYGGRLLGDLLNAVALYQTKRRVVALAVFISLVGHTGLVAGFWCCALSLQVWVPDLWMHYFFMPAAELFASVIPVPGGVGPLEGAIAFFYQLSAGDVVTPETAEATGVGAAIAFRVVTLVISIVGAGYYLLTKQDLQVALDEVAPDGGSNPDAQSLELTAK